MAYIADIPKFGFGTAFELGQGEGKITGSEFKQLLHRAIELGCRHIDCAPLYGTQQLVGETLNLALRSISRSDFFITSKLPINMMRDEHIERSLKKTLSDLQTNYLDLYLIHAPFSTKYVSDDEVYPLDEDGFVLLDEEENLLESAWRKLIDLKSKGYIKYIGLSNVNYEQLDRLHTINPVDVVQNEYHIYFQDREFFDYCEELDVHYEAYAAFGCPPKAKLEKLPSFLEDQSVERVARTYRMSRPQVVIQWLHRQPLSYVIRSDNISQLEENFRATSCNILISVNDMIELDTINKNIRLYLYDQHKGITQHKEYPFKGTSPLQGNGYWQTREA